jgi:hypothetical protein
MQMPLTESQLTAMETTVQAAVALDMSSANKTIISFTFDTDDA